jgi:hypothetical protein
VNEAGYDQRISQLNEVSGRAIYMDLSLSLPTIKDVGFETGAPCDVPYVYRFVWKEPRDIEEVPWNGDATLVVDVGFGDDSSVNLGEKKFSKGSIHGFSVVIRDG